MTNDYWKERIKAEQEAKIERDVSLGDEMKRLYDYHFAEIEKEIRAFEQRYADKNGLTLAQVKERVSEMDVKAFEEKAKRYVAEKDFSAKANSELSLYNLKMRMKRLELLQYQMDLEMVALADSEHKMTEKFLNQEYVKELELQAGLLGRSVLSDGAIKQMAQATLNTPFKGATWSSRIWERQDELRYIAAKMTEDLLLKGKNPTDMIPKLRKEFDVSVSEARRLAVTEGARMATEAQKQAFDANGYTEYEFISEPKACDICKPLDGKIFKVKDMEPGKNAAPMHPYCRCSTAAHYSLSDKEYERIIRESAESMGVEYRPPYYTEEKMSRMYRNKDKNKRRPVNIVRQNKLTKKFRERGGVVWQDDDSERLLKQRKAAAMNYDAYTIVLQKKPTISEILEELYHAEQWLDERLSENPLVKIRAEIEAQHYLLSVEKRYNIPKSETRQTIQNLKYWEEELKKYED
ncbi:minor capsid protein [Streptococcus sp. NLN64]|uniref:minor capsid protein n=1 Tax=Streptococcus sp. NLN64 TaxID=2822799 RepID=UPI0018CB465A|nr:minor capsid protein [Streptococcus sp. NLN64]MBG9366546.1 minor capsid protein [Streptococcus sp. NLN64]